MKYTPPVGGQPNDSYFDANPGAGQKGSPVPAAAIEHPQRELVNLIKLGLGTNAPATDDLTQVHQAVAAMIAAATGSKSITTSVGSGSADSGWSKIMTWTAGAGSRAFFTITGYAGFTSANDIAQSTVLVMMTMGNGSHASNLSLRAYALGGGGTITGIMVKQGADAYTWEIWVEHGSFWNAVLSFSSTWTSLPDFTGATAAGTTAPTGTVYTKTINTLLHSGAVDFTGSITWFARSTAPAGFLKANGAAVSRSTYANLYAAIGTTFGVGDGSTTFNLPDLRSEFVRGWDDGRGVDAARVFGSSQSDELKSHLHYQGAAATGAAGGGGWQSAAYSSGTTYPTSTTGGTETRPRNIALLACIKY